MEDHVAGLCAGRVPTPLPASKWDDVLRRWTFGLDTVTAPKVLCDIVEALVGAVWLDSEGSLSVTWAVAERLLSPVLVPLPGGDPLPAHPVRMIHVSIYWENCET